VDADLDILAMARFVRADDLLKATPAPRFAPQVPNSGLLSQPVPSLEGFNRFFDPADKAAVKART
jgi:hypothetical protein